MPNPIKRIKGTAVWFNYYEELVFSTFVTHWHERRDGSTEMLIETNHVDTGECGRQESAIVHAACTALTGQKWGEGPYPWSNTPRFRIVWGKEPVYGPKG